MTLAYVLFSVMFTVLLIGTILEDRRSTQMEQTIKAILARCHGNVGEAVNYCVSIITTTSNPHLKQEYQTLLDAIRQNKAEGAHAS
jgi:hypothetical protein